MIYGSLVVSTANITQNEELNFLMDIETKTPSRMQQSIAIKGILSPSQILDFSTPDSKKIKTPSSTKEMDFVDF